MGIGEFLDLKLLMDFCNEIDFRLIQILPITDTTCFMNWRDSYPYSSLSVYALHPIYLRVQNLTTDESMLKEMKEKATKLNAVREIDYEDVYNSKIAFLRRIFEKSKKDITSLREYIDFKKENDHWLPSYSVFCCLRDIHKSSDYTQWEQKYRNGSECIDKVVQTHADEVEFYSFIQYHLHKQLSDVVKYGESKRVGLKGDLPIGVNRLG